MAPDAKTMATLIFLYLKGGLDDEQRKILDNWLAESPRNMLLFEKLTSPEELVSKMDRLRKMFPEVGEDVAFMPMFSTPMFPWKRYITVAAAILLFMATAMYFLMHKSSSDVAATTTEQHQKNDLSPGHNGALLKLANGQTIILDSVANGRLAEQGTTEIVIADGHLSYNDLAKSSGSEIYYNELSVPRGRKFQIKLPDGTDVWLNAASTIRYPVKFSGGQRKVELTGEAYFEVMHDSKMPFVVNVGSNHKTNIVVLGTHFNIMAYPNEDVINTTLLEGSVSVNSGQYMAPPLLAGEQAIISNLGRISVSLGDVNKAVAWKNGFFSFKNDNIETVMKQIERWYDVDVVYEDKIPQTFKGLIPSSVSVSNIFQALETTGTVHFRIDGRKIIVTK